MSFAPMMDCTNRPKNKQTFSSYVGLVIWLAGGLSLVRLMVANFLKLRSARGESRPA
jgi:hypothetical protein